MDDTNARREAVRTMPKHTTCDRCDEHTECRTYRVTWPNEMTTFDHLCNDCMDFVTTCVVIGSYGAAACDAETIASVLA